MTHKHSTDQEGIVGKICGHCKLWYPLNVFNKKCDRKDGLRSWCKKCEKHYRSIHVKEIGNYRIVHKIERCEYDNDRRKKLKPVLRRLKKNGCAECGSYKKLEFHHVNPVDKEFNIGTRYYCHNNEKLANEINKCILLCHKCHTKYWER